MNRRKYMQLQNVKWFLIWTLIYSFLLWILNLVINQISSQYNFLNNQIGYFLLIGLGLSIFSKLIFCAIRKRHFKLNFRIIYWWIVFIILLLLINFLIDLASNSLHWNVFNLNWFIILITGALMSLGTKFLRRVQFGNNFSLSHLPGWIWWLVVIGAIIFLIQFHIPYDTKPLSDFNLKCEEGNLTIKNDLFGVGTLGVEFEAALTCMEYKSSRCRYICENGKPACQCEAALVHYLFTREGEWFFGGW